MVMTPANLYPAIPAQLKKAAQTVTQTAIELKVTTAAICGAAQKRWSIEWKG
jgi:hypothetical protein